MLFCTHIFSVLRQVLLVFACVELRVDLPQQWPLRARGLPVTVLVLSRCALLPGQRGALQDLRKLQRERSAVQAGQQKRAWEQRLVLRGVGVDTADP